VRGSGVAVRYPTAPTVDFDAPAALKEWKSSGKAPDQIIVTIREKGKAARKRLVCAFPQVAHYGGTGDVIDPASFACKSPEGARIRF
jgi:feruloyl esterase